MSAWQLVTELWLVNSWAWLIAGLAVGAYAWEFGFRRRARSWAFVGAVGLFLLATVSPIAVLADGYLFSAHIVQHLLLLLLIPPLLIFSLPPASVEAALDKAGPRFLEETLGRPPISWMLGLGIMWLWHVPSLCTASVTSTTAFVAQCATLLFAGVAFYWPVMHPLRTARISPPGAIAYLFTGCLACTLLGVLLTFAPVSACPVYMHPVDTLGVMPLVRGQWQLTHAADQQIGGLMMWIPACLIYLIAILVIARNWLAEGEIDVATREDRHGAG